MENKSFYCPIKDRIVPITDGTCTEWDKCDLGGMAGIGKRNREMINDNKKIIANMASFGRAYSVLIRLLYDGIFVKMICTGKIDDESNQPIVEMVKGKVTFKEEKGPFNVVQRLLNKYL